MATRVLLIGRHNDAFFPNDIEVVETRSVQFPATAAETKVVVEQLLKDAESFNAKLLFQACPGQLAAAVSSILGTRYYEQNLLTYIGFVISKPGKRESGATYRFSYSEALEHAVMLANPNAKLTRDGDELILVVDPPMVFQFDHIEWLG